jgi:predicted amidohydrolase
VTRAGGGSRRGGLEEMEAHWEGLPTAARLGRRSTAVVAGPEGRRRRRRGRRGAECWCGACGGKARGGRWPEMVAHMEALVKETTARRTAVPEAPHGG